MSNQIDAQSLPRKWIHSHEEDTDDEIVFRPDSYTFPRSRGRRGFELTPDGGMIEHGIGSDDRPKSTAGSWQLKNTNELELTSGGANAKSTVMSLVAVGPDKLVAKKSI
jgi:hypothetical protein